MDCRRIGTATYERVECNMRSPYKIYAIKLNANIYFVKSALFARNHPANNAAHSSSDAIKPVHQTDLPVIVKRAIQSIHQHNAPNDGIPQIVYYMAHTVSMVRLPNSSPLPYFIYRLNRI